MTLTQRISFSLHQQKISRAKTIILFSSLIISLNAGTAHAKMGGASPCKEENIDSELLMLSDARQLTEARVGAAQCLGDLKVEKAVSALGLILKSDEEDLQRSSFRALESIGNGLALNLLDSFQREQMNYLKGGDLKLQIKAARFLGELKTNEAIPFLLDISIHGKGMLRDNAIRSLGDMGSKEAVPSLLQNIKHEDWYTRVVTTYALSKCGAENSDVISVLLSRLKDENEHVRHEAVTALGNVKIRQEEVVDVLIHLLESTDSFTRYLAARSLLGLRPFANKAVPSLIKLLRDEVHLVNNEAINTLQAIGTPEAIKAIQDHFNSSSQ